MITPEVSRSSMQQWFDENPLRQWRRQWKITRKVAAHFMNVSAGTIHNWECGLGQPGLEHFARLDCFRENALQPIKATHINWSDRWKDWLDNKPEIPEQKTA